MSSRWISTSARARGRILVDRGMRRLDERALAGAAGAPQQDIVGRQAGGEPLGVVEQDVADPVDAAQQADLDAVDLVDRLEPAAVGVPDESVARVEIGGAALPRREPLQRIGNAMEERQQIGIGHRQIWGPAPAWTAADASTAPPS